DQWVVVGELGAEVQPLLAVRSPVGQLGPDREVPAPGPAATRHRDRHLVRLGQPEERPAGRVEPGDQARRYAVPGHVEEAGLPAGALDLPGDRVDLRARPAGQALWPARTD